MASKGDKFKNGKDTEIEKQIEKTDPVGKQTNTGIEDEDLEKIQAGVATGKYEVLVKDKKGFFSSAIPTKLPCCVAILLCFFNCVCPGLGTLISAPFSLCEKERTQKRRIRNFFVNILASFLQLATTPLILIGWLWSIMWALEFLKPLKGEGYENS